MKKSIILTICVVALFVAIVTGFSLWNGGKSRDRMKLSVKNDLQEYDIEVIGPADPDFDSELKQYVGKYSEVAPLVDVAEPFAVFINNNSPKEIVGIALRWELVKFNGEINKVNQIETSPGVLMGMKPLDPFMVGKTSLINSNSHRFMSYFYGIGQQVLNAFKSNRSKRFEYKLDSDEAQVYISDTENQKQVILRDVSSVSVAVDAVIFDDGTFVGENQSFLFEIMSGTLQAKKDFLRRLRAAKQSAKSDTDSLNEFISEMKSISVADSRPTLKYVDGKDAFNQTYQYQLAGYSSEINRKRLRATDKYIVKDFLSVDDSDFIDLRKK